MSKFTHLHVHSHYSLLDGLAKIPDIVKRAKDTGMDAIAVTDHGVLYGAVEFYKAAKKADIKPILGVETYVAPRDRFSKEPGERYYHLILLAENMTGWKNMITLVTKAHLEGFYYRPRVDKDLLREHHEGLIALSACLGSEIGQALASGNFEDAKRIALEYQEIFGVGNYFLEIQKHPHIPDSEKIEPLLIKLSEATGIPLVATQDSHYVHSDENQYHDVLLAVQTGNQLSDDDRMSMKEDDFSILSPEEMEAKLGHIAGACERTNEIAARCNVELELIPPFGTGKFLLPEFPKPDGKTANAYVRELVTERLSKKYPPEMQTQEIKDRVEYELGVIEKTGFADYFLIVQDLINWAKAHGIAVGPGRGSAAGSIISYILNITDIDPLKYNLLFERFLNPERISMPDIDIDFSDVRRDEVLAYARDKYGEDRVARIITFGTMAARAAIRDAGRAMGYSYAFCDQIAKLIPFNPTQGMKEGWLDECLKTVAELKALYDGNPEAKKLIETALHLEGVARHASVHACGTVIAKDKLIERVPLQFAPQDKDILITQFEMHAVEDLGLLKIDFLGLKNLTIIENTVRLVKELKDTTIEISTIPLDDKKTLDLLQRADTTGVFQFECLSGDTIVSNTTIKKLYERKDKTKLNSVYLDSGKVHKNKILAIAQSGIKEVFALVGENGWYIKASGDHRFLTENGWKAFHALEPGDKVFIKSTAKHLIYNRCDGCGDQIDGQKEGKGRFCYSCSARHHSNPSKPVSRKNMRAARKKFFASGGTTWNKGGTTETSETWRKAAGKISEALTGKTFEDWYGPEQATERKLELSKRFSGNGNPMFGKRSPHRKGGFREDLGHYVRSNWEADFARVLNLYGVAYQYEPQTFTLVEKTGAILHYTPDFFVPSTNTFYEIKGWFHKLDQKKVALFQEQYPHYNFELIDKTRFAEFALRYKNLVAWECPRFPKRGHEFIAIEKIVSCGKEMTYDIAMEAPGNNFVANGFVVHNSSGMRRYMKEIQPNRFEDLIALVALFRPGPMELIPSYIKRKHGKEKVVYLHPKLEPIMAETYGVGVYQEQMMAIARNLGGYSLPEADTLRKAIGKKIKSLLDEQGVKLTAGMIKNGIPERTAKQIWELFPPFARYGFPKAHAACYALIGYQTAYLKANYPEEFMAALLNAELNDVERISVLIQEAKQTGVNILPPDINKSFVTFTPEGPQIRFGLSAIKNVGSEITRVVIEERTRNGPFASIEDMLTRIQHKDMNKKSLESLAKAGAFDSLGIERNQILENIDDVLRFSNALKRGAAQTGANSLFGGGTLATPRLTLKPATPATNEQKLGWEKELIGFYLSEHPMAKHAETIKLARARTIPELMEIKNEKLIVRTCGLVSKIKKIVTKSGQPMIFATIEDAAQKPLEVVVFNSVLEKTSKSWEQNNIVLVQGRMSFRDGQAKLICDNAKRLS